MILMYFFMFYMVDMLNGYKIVIYLEEVGFVYDCVLVDLFVGEQCSLVYFVINLNGKILVIVDYDMGFVVFEFGVIFGYFVVKIGCLQFDMLVECMVVQ